MYCPTINVIVIFMPGVGWKFWALSGTRLVIPVNSSYSPDRTFACPGPVLNCAWMIASSFFAPEKRVSPF